MKGKERKRREENGEKKEEAASMMLGMGVEVTAQLPSLQYVELAGS